MQVTICNFLNHSGVLGAAVLPVVGVGVGLTQMVRGVANTPEAIRETQRGKHWDTVSVLRVLLPPSRHF